MKILLLDIETAPNTAHVWGLWQQNVGLPQILEAGYVLCWAAKWLGTEEVMFDSSFQSGHKTMLNRIHRLLNEADAVVHYHGTKFDIPTLNKEFVIHEMNPPAPYKQIDLLKVAKKEFKFPSNKLSYVAEALGVGQKVKHIGHELWIRCMSKDPEAWEMMKEYNMGDVILLEKVYYRLLPWIKNHANHNNHTDEAGCPNCSSDRFVRRGFSHTATMSYRRFRCSSCGTWFRSNKAEKRQGEKYVSV